MAYHKVHCFSFVKYQPQSVAEQTAGWNARECNGPGDNENIMYSINFVDLLEHVIVLLVAVTD